MIDTSDLTKYFVQQNDLFRPLTLAVLTKRNILRPTDNVHIAFSYDNKIIIMLLKRHHWGSHVIYNGYYITNGVTSCLRGTLSELCK